ncbi:MAG: tetratricopeptide repeat protein [Burkholderiaceae bacterium]|nr:tetratricopeptide repeat protein [Burkholderiaceae bacterium]
MFGLQFTHFLRRLASARLSALAGLLCLPLATQAALFEEKVPLPNNDLDGSLLYQIIASEVALQNQDPALAFQTYLSMARKTKDPRLAQRAFEIADTVHAYKEALEATQLWQTLAPMSASAQGANALVRLRLGESDNTLQKVIIDLLKKTADQQERENFLYQVIVQTDIGLNDANKTLAFLQPCLSLVEHRNHVALALTKLYRQVGNFEQVQHYARRAYQDLPDNTSAMLEYADTQTKSNLQVAIATIEAFIAKHPKDLDAHLGLAKAFAKAKQAQKALSEIQLIEKRQADNPGVIFALAGIADNVGLTNETTRLLEKFEKLAHQKSGYENKLPQTYLALGVNAYRQKDYEKAIAQFKKIEKDSDLYIQAKILEAHCLAATNQGTAAIKMLEKLSAGKRQFEVLETQAKITDQLKRYGDSYRFIKKALDLKPNDAALLYRAAITAEKLGRLDDAEKWLEHGIEQYPEKPDFYNALGYLWANKGIHLDKAKRLLDKALRMSPNDSAILDSMGWLYFKKKQFVEAERYLLKATKKSSDKEIWLHLAELYHAQGKTDKTMEILRTLMPLYPKDEMIEQMMDRLHLHF